MSIIQPDFSQLLTVLERKRPDRPVLFEFYMNDNVYDAVVDTSEIPPGDEDFRQRMKMALAFHHLGYDYATILPGKHLFFPELREQHEQQRTYSLNEGSHIDSWAAFEQYPWPDYSTQDYRYLEQVAAYLPEGMKLIPYGPGGVEEIVISLTGYENLCYLMMDQEDLVDALFEAVGSRLEKYYGEVVTFDSVGACLSNDDWGFNTQTLLSPTQMERWVVPWHRKISQAIHSYNKPALLHSWDCVPAFRAQGRACGNRFGGEDPRVCEIICDYASAEYLPSPDCRTCRFHPQQEANERQAGIA